MCFGAFALVKLKMQCNDYKYISIFRRLPFRVLLTAHRLTLLQKRVTACTCNSCRRSSFPTLVAVVCQTLV